MERESPSLANGMGEAALAFGAVALLCSFVPVVGDLVAAPAGLLAIVLGLVGVGRAEKGRASNMGRAVAGVILGTAAIVLVVIALTAALGPLH